MAKEGIRFSLKTTYKYVQVSCFETKLSVTHSDLSICLLGLASVWHESEAESVKLTRHINITFCCDLCSTKRHNCHNYLRSGSGRLLARAATRNLSYSDTGSEANIFCCIDGAS